MLINRDRKTLLCSVLPDDVFIEKSLDLRRLWQMCAGNLSFDLVVVIDISLQISMHSLQI